MKDLVYGIFGQLRLIFASRLGVWLLTLLVAMSVLSGAIYQRLVLRDIPVAVVDLDATHMTRLIATGLDATPELAIQSIPSGSLERARERLERGEVAAYVLLPAGFTEQLKRGEKAQLVLATDMSNLLAGKTVRAACSRVIATLNAGTEITVLRKLGSSRATATARAVPIVVEDNQLFNPATNYAEYLVPIVVYFLLHIYATVLFGGSFLEGKDGRAPTRRFGQLIASWGVCSAFALVAWFLLPLAGAAMASPWWLGGLVFTAYAASQAAFVAFVAKLVPNETLAFQLVLFLSMLGLMLSGVTWPTYAFPAPLAALSETLPFTHLARLLRMTAHFEASMTDVTGGVVALFGLMLGYATVATIAATTRRVSSRLFPRMNRHVAT